MSSVLKITPLGGLGEIGRNCTAYEYDDQIIVVDAGLMFPTDDMLGIDLVIPDYTYLIENQTKVRAVVLTHGHEDHIGGLSYLLNEVPVPVYGTPLTLGLVESRLKRRNLLELTELWEMHPGDIIDEGPFTIRPFHVNHSIPDSVGLAIETPVGLVVHTGDFKIDHTPIEGEPTDLAELARLSAEGVRLLLSDSTNAESAGYTISESALRDTFERAFSSAKGRIIIATFASLLSRSQLVVETAHTMGRKVALAGRSMIDNVAIAEKLGLLKIPPNTMIDLNTANSMPDDQVCILATGTQGEPNAALARMATGRFRGITIQEGDTVLLSSKAIPGNETRIYSNIDKLFRQGANVIYGTQAGIHVSGHAASEEQKLMINLLRPDYFVPIHGDYRMLHRHAAMAREMNMDNEHVFILTNGEPLELNRTSAWRGEPLEMRTVLVDGLGVGDVGQTILRDRASLARDGFVVIRVDIDAETGNLIDDPEVITQGFIYLPESTEFVEETMEIIRNVAEHTPASKDGNTEQLTLNLRKQLERFFHDETQRRPVLVIMAKAR